MARRKPKQILLVKDLAGADEALAEIAEIKRSMALIETDMNEEIDRAKEAATVKCAPLQERMQALEGGILAYAEYNKTELFAKKKSVELQFGTIGFRKSTKLKTAAKTTWEMVLGKLRELAFTDAIRKKEEVNKDVLATWPVERLKLVGVKREEEDTFWLEISEQTLQVESGGADIRATA